MAKKLGKLVLFSALAGAAAAGTYYYLQNKKNDSSDDFDDIDDFDDFDEDLDDDIDLTAKTANVTESKNRSYIDLENVKGKIGEKVIETIDKTKETLDKAEEFIDDCRACFRRKQKRRYTDRSYNPNSYDFCICNLCYGRVQKVQFREFF